MAGRYSATQATEDQFTVDPLNALPHEHANGFIDTSDRVINKLFDTQITESLNSRIDRPFAGWTPDQIENYVESFVELYGLQGYRSLFERVASLIEEPRVLGAWADDEDDEEKLALRHAEKEALEKASRTTFWDQPWPLKTTVLMLCTAAVVQGWSQTGLNAANLSWPKELGLAENRSFRSGNPTKSHGGGWAFAAVNAAPYFAASIGCWVSDPLSERFYGRRPAIMASAVFILVATIGSAFAQSWQMLLAFRLVLGLGMGCKATIVPVFAAEVAPAPSRGSLIMNWQVFDALGIALGFVANAVASVAGKTNAWRWQIGSLCIPTWALLWGVLYVRWDSPRYLMKHEQRIAGNDRERRERLRQFRDRRNVSFSGRLKLLLIHLARDFGQPGDVHEYKSPAFRALVLLRGSEVLAAMELLFAHTQILIERHSDKEREPDQRLNNKDISLQSQISWKAWWTRLQHVLGGDDKEYLRRQTWAAFCLMLSQQLCGINILIFYSSTVFYEQGRKPQSSAALRPLMLSFGLGMVNFLAALPAYQWIESHGRRWLLIFTIPLLMVLMACVAGCFAIEDNLTRTVSAVVFTYLFTAVYSPGLGPVPFTYCAEIFPLEQRMVGMSVAVSVNFFFAGVLTLFVPKIAAKIGLDGLFGVFTACNLAAIILIWRYVPEVVGEAKNNDRSQRAALGLEQLFYVFRSPMSDYRRYYRKVYVKYVWRCWKAFFRSPKRYMSGETQPNPPPVFHVWIDNVSEAQRRRPM